MIIEFSDSIREKEDEDSLLNLSKLLQSDNLLAHKLFIQEITLDWMIGKLLEDNTYFSEKGKGFFAYLLSLVSDGSYITQTHRMHLSSVTIGYNTNELSPKTALQMINLPSRIILENGTNDWKFIQGIAGKYKNDSKRGTIYRLIERSITDNRLLPIHAGGSDIQPRIEATLCEGYQGISKYKLYTVFDSDRVSKDEHTDAKHEKLVAYLSSADCILWHILYKREMENYMPHDMLSKLDKDRSTGIVKHLSQFSVEEYDFIDMESEIKKINDKIKTKEELPALFSDKDLSKQSLEKRCEHHKEDRGNNRNHVTESLSELECILLDIAKII